MATMVTGPLVDRKKIEEFEESVEENEVYCLDCGILISEISEGVEIAGGGKLCATCVEKEVGHEQR